ncbi:hypothetical protein [Pantoea sp. Ep11b]|uniref:hypothetical protein n=1 Tax=Pantoea sp. Ep11b TaxID=3141459 RepID=UPI003460F577
MPKKSRPKSVVHDLWSDSQLDLKPLDYHQIAHAALGTISPEIYSKTLLPIGRGFSSRQYNRLDAIERVKTILKQSDLLASVTTSEVIAEMERAGVGINQVQLFLDPFFRKTKKEAFKALRKNLLLNEEGVQQIPVTATLAIDSKIIPSPDITWRGRFSMIASYPHRSKNPQIPRGKNPLVESINTTESYLWAFPPADYKATCMASLDSYNKSQKRESAEMGMGFCIIQSPFARNVHPLRSRSNEEIYQQYSLYTPIWHLRSRDYGWALGNIIHSDIRVGAPWSEYRLEELLPEGLRSLPRIHACRNCQMLFIDKTPGHEDVPISCNCVKSSALNDAL